MMKIVKSLAIIVAVVAVAGAVTYSAWIDEGSILGIEASTDTMDLKIDKDPSSTNQVWVDSFNFSDLGEGAVAGLTKLKPGFTSQPQIIDIKNVGDVAGKATLKFHLTSSKENGLTQPEGLVPDSNYYGTDSNWNGELAQNMRVNIRYSADNSANWIDLGSDTLAGLHDRVLNLGDVTGGTAGDGKIASVELTWSIPTSANNEIMSDTLTTNLVFGLEAK